MIVALMLLSLILSAFFGKANAQVTIGSGISPREGLVLDMNADVSNNTGAGMGLPRAALTDISVLTLAGDPEQLQGTLVYNTNNDIAGGTGVGVYNWDGLQWQTVSQWLRLDTVYVNPANKEDIRVGKYNTLQRAYDMESRKIYNQLAGQAVVFLCSGGNVGGLMAKGTIASVTINGNAGTTFDGRLAFNFSTARLEGDVNTNGKIVTINNSFLFLGHASSPLALRAGSLNLEQGMAVASNIDVDMVLTNNLALDYNSTMVAGIKSLKAKRILVRRGSILEINEGSLNISNKSQVESVSSFLLTSSNASDKATIEGIEASDNSAVDIRIPVILKNNNKIYEGFNSMNNSTIKVTAEITVSNHYSTALLAATGGTLRFSSLTTSGTVAPNQVAYATTGGTVIHDGGLITATVATNGFYAANGGSIILNGVENPHKITAKTGSSNPVGLKVSGGSSIIEIYNKNSVPTPDVYTFDNFRYGMSVFSGGRIYAGGLVDVSTATAESNYPAGTNLGTVLNTGAVIYNISN